MGKFLYRIYPVRHEMIREGLNEFESPIVDEHFNYLKRLTDDGVVILAGKTRNRDDDDDDKRLAFVIFKAQTVEAARETTLNDPAVKSNVFRVELYPFGIALFGPENAK